MTHNTADSLSKDPLYDQLRAEALHASQTEPSLYCLLSRTILHPSVDSFSSAVACSVSHRLSQPGVCREVLNDMLIESLACEELEAGHTMAKAVKMDAEACVERDPACKSLLEAVIFYKGYAALVVHRAARRKWNKTLEGRNNKSRFASLWLQSQASAAFGVDIHPAASIGAGVVFDHGTGIVIGETATVGDGCTLLHGVTLGGTGKEDGDRHPKVGNNVLLGANASVLGNVRIGNNAKIGAGSIVLKPIPSGATAVGAPAKIICWPEKKCSGSNTDIMMQRSAVAKEGGGNKDSVGCMGNTLSETLETMSAEIDVNEDSDSSVDGVSSTNADEDAKDDDGDLGGDKEYSKDDDGLSRKLNDSDHPVGEPEEKQHEHGTSGCDKQLTPQQQVKKVSIVHTTSRDELCPWRHVHETSNATLPPPQSITKCLLVQGDWNAQALRKRERNHVESIIPRNSIDLDNGRRMTLMVVDQMESLKPMISV